MQTPNPDTILVAQAIGDTLTVQNAEPDPASALELIGILLGSIGTLGVALLGYLRYQQESSTHEDIAYRRRLDVTEEMLEKMVNMCHELDATSKAAKNGDDEAAAAHAQRFKDIHDKFGTDIHLMKLYLPQEIASAVGDFQDSLHKHLKTKDEEHLSSMKTNLFAVAQKARDAHGLPKLSDQISDRLVP